MRKIATFSLTVLLLIATFQVGFVFALENFQLKKSVIVPGAGSSFKYGIYGLVQIIGEAIGGESSSSANFSISSGYYSNPAMLPSPELTIISINPENLSKVYQNQSIQITIKAAGGNLVSLQYQFSINGQLKQDWYTSNSYSWVISDADIGKNHLIEVKARDGLGRVAVGQSKIFILHKPVEPPSRTSPRRCGGKGQLPCAAN